ncbi:MAG: tetratricopeptide repeat protein, partial [Thermodesulfobacteriota bacterium]
MGIFTVHLGRFIEPGSLTPPVVLPSYLSEDRKRDLLDLLVSGLGNPPVLRIGWGEDRPELVDHGLRVHGLTLRTEGAVVLGVVDDDEELHQALTVLPKVACLLPVYDACARCGVEHHQWVYDLKGMLIQFLERRGADVVAGLPPDLDLAFPLHAFGDPLDVLAFLNARVSPDILGLREPEASWTSFAQVMAGKLKSLEQQDLALLLRLIAQGTDQNVALAAPGETTSGSLARLEAAGLVFVRKSDVALRAPVLRLREPELLEKTVLRMGPERLGEEGERLYEGYLARLRPPSREAVSAVMAERAEMTFGLGPADLNEVKACLQEAGERVGLRISPDDGDLAEVERSLLDEGGRRRALGLAVRAYQALQNKRLSEGLEDASLARRADPALKDFALAVRMYLGEIALFQRHMEDAIEHLEAYLAEGGDRARAHRRLGQAYENLGYWDRAIDFFNRALEEAAAAGDHGQESAALGNLGNVYADKGEWERAIEFYQKDLAIS